MKRLATDIVATFREIDRKSSQDSKDSNDKNSSRLNFNVDKLIENIIKTNRSQ